MKRAISSFIGISLAIVVIFSNSIIPLTVVIGVIAVWGLCEFYRSIQKIGVQPIWWLGILTTVLFVLTSAFKSGSMNILPHSNITIQGFAHFNILSDGHLDITPLFPLIITTIFLAGFITEFLRKERAPIKNIGATLFGALYVGWLISHIISLKAFGGTTVLFGHTVSMGSSIAMLMLLCTWATDTFAFLIGKNYGKHKISPKSSPNKTWEGSIGGLLGSIVIGGSFGYFIGIPIIHVLILCFICGIISQLGDLTESAIKREIGIKDFSNLIPGHGGILDRIDSMLFTAPATYYYVLTFLYYLIS